MGAAAVQVTQYGIQVLDYKGHDTIFEVFGQKLTTLGWVLTSQHPLESPVGVGVAGPALTCAAQLVCSVALSVVATLLAEN